MSQTNLTVPQLQSLKALLKEEITFLSEDIANSKRLLQQLFILADKDDEVNGKFFFDCLNIDRNRLRKDKKRLKNLVDIQKSIKSEILSRSFSNSWVNSGFFESIFG